MVIIVKAAILITPTINKIIKRCLNNFFWKYLIVCLYLHPCNCPPFIWMARGNNIIYERLNATFDYKVAFSFTIGDEMNFMRFA